MKKIEKQLYRYGDLMEQAREIEEEVRGIVERKIEVVDNMMRTAFPVKAGHRNTIDPVYDVVEKLVNVYDAQIADASERLKEIYAEYERMKNRIAAAGLDEHERRYIKRRYVDRTSHMTVAVETGYYERKLARIRLSALKKIANVGR